MLPGVPSEAGQLILSYLIWHPVVVENEFRHVLTYLIRKILERRAWNERHYDHDVRGAQMRNHCAGGGCFADRVVYTQSCLYHKTLVRLVLEIQDYEAELKKLIMQFQFLTRIRPLTYIREYRDIRCLKRCIIGDWLCPDEYDHDADVPRPLHPDWLPPVPLQPTFQHNINYESFLVAFDWHVIEYGFERGWETFFRLYTAPPGTPGRRHRNPHRR